MCAQVAVVCMSRYEDITMLSISQDLPGSFNDYLVRMYRLKYVLVEYDECRDV